MSGSTITFGAGNTLTLDGAVTAAGVSSFTFVTVSQSSIDNLG